MATPGSTADNAIDAKLLQQLSHTPYACSSLSPPLSSRDGNVVYRGILAKPIRTHDGDAAAKSIIIKHSTGGVSKIFESLLLNSITNFSSSTATVKAPRLYLYNQETNTQVLEDFSNTDGLKAILFSTSTHDALSLPNIAEIGYNIGLWLQSFHTWALSPEQADLREQIWQNDHVRKTKYLFTYGGVFKILENYPELLEGHEKTLHAFDKFMSEEFDKPSSEEADGYGLLHGDFWSGNILVRASEWREPPLEHTTKELFIIDWEFAQFGHRSTDLGQIVGDLYERKVYNNLENAIPIMEAVIKGYGTLSDDMAFRTAIYVGVHLISYYNRRPRKGPRAPSPDVILVGLTLGRDLVVKGWERDRTFFESSALASLFAAR